MENRLSKCLGEYLLLILAAIEIIVALFFFLQNPSDPDLAVFWGLSPFRLVIAIIFTGFLVVNVGLLVKALRRPEWFNHYVEKFKAWLNAKNRRYYAVIFLLYLFLMLLAFLLVFYSSKFQIYEYYSKVFSNRLRYYEIFRALVNRLLPLLILGLVIAFQSSIWLLFGFSWEKTRNRSKVILQILLVLVIFTLSFSHWVILIIQLKTFMNIPGWYWDLSVKPFGIRDGIFVVLLVLALAVVRTVLRNPGKVRRNLFLIFLVGWSLQVGFGFIEGQGFESLRKKYVDSSHRTHASQAVKATLSWVEIVRNYEDRYNNLNFQNTKPPGTLLIYIALKNVANIFFPSDTLEGEFEVLTTVESYVFPVISFLVVFFIYKVAKKIHPGEGSILPSIFYVLLPNVILIPLFLDQVLYPLLFTLGALLTIYTVEKGSFAWGLLNGVLIYIIAFFSFSMLPLIPFAFLYIGIHYLKDKNRDLNKSILMGLGNIFGLALMFVLFYFALNYNFFVRYTSAMEMVRSFDFLQRVQASPDEIIENTSFLLKPKQIFSALFLNNTETASAVGFPIFLLFLIQFIRTVLAVIKKQSNAGDTVLLTYFGTFVLMNLFAPMQGEAARLWLFWAPMFAIFAGVMIPKIFTRYHRFVYLLVVMQLMTIFLTFKFQDLAP